MSASSQHARDRRTLAPRVVTQGRRSHWHGRTLRRRRSGRERGIALIVVLAAIAVLTVLLADLQQSTSTAYAVAINQRDRLQAEYMAKSGLNLTRLLVANEPLIRKTVAPMYQMLIGRPPPQVPVWELATEILQPFCDYEAMKASESEMSFELGAARGMGDLPGRCEIVAVAENAKINLNDPLFLDGDSAKKSTAMQLFALMGGYHSPSPFDPLFARADRDGQFTSRLDVVSAIIDWWDTDTERTNFDPGAAEVQSAGSEDDYNRLDDPYKVKNAPLDSLEELRLVRGVGDDFWATFIEPTPGDPKSRAVTIYGSGSVNVNSAPPQVMLARLCSFIDSATLCVDPVEAAKFIQLVTTVRSMFPVPFFTRATDFLNFLEGKGGPRELYPMLTSMLGPENPLVFKPITIPADRRTELSRTFITSAAILTIQSSGFVGRSHVQIDSVLNFHDRWTPPPPNAGSLPKLGVFHYYRVQ